MESSIREIDHLDEALQSIEVKQIEIPPSFFDMDDDVQDFLELYQAELDRIRDLIQNVQKLSTTIIPKVKETLKEQSVANLQKQRLNKRRSLGSTISVDSSTSSEYFTDEEHVKRGPEVKNKKKKRSKKGRTGSIAKRWQSAVSEEQLITKRNSYRFRDFKKPDISEKMRQLGYDFGKPKTPEPVEVSQDEELRKLGFLSTVTKDNVEFESLHMEEVFDKIHDLQHQLEEFDDSKATTEFPPLAGSLDATSHCI